VPFPARAVLNGSDMARWIVVTGDGGRVIPFRGKEMRRRTGAKRAKLAHQMGLVGVPVGEGEVGPRHWRAHDRLPPGPCEACEAFEPLRRHAHLVEKSPMKVSSRQTEFRCQIGNRDRQIGAQQTIDRTDDEIISRRRAAEMLEKCALDRGASVCRVDSWCASTTAANRSSSALQTSPSGLTMLTTADAATPSTVPARAGCSRMPNVQISGDIAYRSPRRGAPRPLARAGCRETLNRRA